MNGKPFSSQYAVHPHLRGAYAALPRQQLIFPGSSPHTWGIPLLGLRMLLPDRFIPTHVGHTQDRAGMSTPRSVHPHLRGAYVVHIRQLFRRDGSSPHTWGIRPNHGNPTSTPGSSPHTWGIRIACLNCGYTFTVHPHIRGVYDHLDLGIVGPARFIPTYVGYTPDRPHHPAGVPVHPHIRGAYGVAQGMAIMRGGSSPHTWGIQS